MALNEVTCSILTGRVHGLLGPNGAGKSTLMNILAGVLPQSSGVVNWAEGIEPKIGFLPEFAPLYGGMRVIDYLFFIAALKKIYGDSEITRVIELCHLEDVQTRLIENLSRGYRQRVNLAQALLAKPTFLILDEPFIGLDPQSIQDVRNLILSLRGEVTILFSSHQLHEVESICDDLTVMHKGNVLKNGTLSDIVHSVETQSLITITLENSEDDWISLLSQNFSTIDVTIEFRDNATILSISYGKREEFRADIIKLIVDNGGKILEVKKLELSLEDAFEKMLAVV